MDELILIAFVLLFIKHYLVDFVLQTPSEVENKGKYGNLIGIGHSVKHGFATGAIFFTIGIHPSDFWILALIDTLIHYHVDWIKMRFGCRDISQKRFWNQLGLDQLAHYLTYALLVWLVYI